MGRNVSFKGFSVSAEGGSGVSNKKVAGFGCQVSELTG
jgi:hypothetical protein